MFVAIFGVPINSNEMQKFSADGLPKLRNIRSSAFSTLVHPHIRPTKREGKSDLKRISQGSRGSSSSLQHLKMTKIILLCLAAATLLAFAGK